MEQQNEPASALCSCVWLGGSIFLANLPHAYAQTGGAYDFPNSREGDMLKTAKREIEYLRETLGRISRADSLENARYAAFRAREVLSPNGSHEPRDL